MGCRVPARDFAEKRDQCKLDVHVPFHQMVVDVRQGRHPLLDEGFDRRIPLSPRRGVVECPEEQRQYRFRRKDDDRLYGGFSNAQFPSPKRASRMGKAVSIDSSARASAALRGLSTSFETASLSASWPEGFPLNSRRPRYRSTTSRSRSPAPASYHRGSVWPPWSRPRTRGKNPPRS